jgi:4-amino-4-deoxy-L-arabinose transferase-like glycosyltransferase
VRNPLTWPAQSRVRTGLALLAVGLLAGMLRLYAMESTFPVRLLGDERYYVNTALNIAQGRGHVFKKTSRLWRPPAHAYLLSLFVSPEVSRALDAKGDPIEPSDLRKTVRRFLHVEVALSTGLVLATGLLGWALFGRGCALLAAAFAALYPNFIAYSHYLWSESLFAGLVAVGLAGVVYAQRYPSRRRAAMLGLVFGLAALTREAAIAVVALCAFWWVQQAVGAARRRALCDALAMLLVAAAVVIPWTIRNYSVHGRFIPVSSIGWFAAAQGNTLETRDWLMQDGPAHVRFEREYFAIPGEVERMDFARWHTLERVREAQPSWLWKKLVLNPALLLTPDAYPLYKYRRGAYGELDASSVALLHAMVIGSYVLVFVIGVLGFASAPAGGSRLLVGWVIATALLVHVLANADTRFRLPWMPLLIIYGSNALQDPGTAWARLRGRAGIFALSVLSFFFAVCVPYFFLYGGRR